MFEKEEISISSSKYQSFENFLTVRCLMIPLMKQNVFFNICHVRVRDKTYF